MKRIVFKYFIAYSISFRSDKLRVSKGFEIETLSRSLIIVATTLSGSRACDGEQGNKANSTSPVSFSLNYLVEKTTMDCFDSRYFRATKQLMSIVGLWPYQTFQQMLFFRTLTVVIVLSIAIPEVRSVWCSRN